jgi:hypothetical protein
MLETFIQQLDQELHLHEQISTVEPGHYKLTFDTLEIDAEIRPPHNHYLFTGTIGKRSLDEKVLIKLMEANLFGKGTLGATLGLKEDESALMLVREVDANASYKEWRDKLEDFLNILEFWQKQALNPH